MMRRQQWLTRVDEAVKMRMRARGESREGEAQADDEFLGDITPARLVRIKKVVSGLKKPNYSTAFKTQIDPVIPGILNCPEIVKIPLDLSNLETKLKKTTEKAAIASEDSRATRVESHLTEPAMERRLTQGTVKIEDGEITETVFTNQSPSENGARLPTRKRRRIEPREQAVTNAVQNKERLEAFVAAEEQRAKALLALINQAATPQTLQAMNDIYEHSFGTRKSRATAAFAQALQMVTTAIGTARRERASYLQEITDEVDELRDME